jgi:3-dehydroquinate synthase
MAMALRYSVKLGLCPGQDAVRAERLLNELGLETRIPNLGGGPYGAEDLLAHMAHDKKARNGRFTLILSKGIGKAFIQRDADVAPLRQFLASEVAGAS